MRIEVPLGPFKVNKNYQIVIPQILREAMRLKRGNLVEWSNIDVEEGKVSFRLRVAKKSCKKGSRRRKKSANQ